jgi:ABC-type protease/lipase transport system fused ATPase/permease subunit
MRVVNSIIALGVTAAFLGGAAVALLISAPLHAVPIYVCFVATFLALLACLLCACSIMIATARRERLSVERIIDLTVDRMLHRRGLEVVDDA